MRAALLIYIRKLCAKKRKSFEKFFYFRKRLFFALLGLAAFVEEYGLSLTPDDLRCCRAHFRAEERDPTLTEIRVLDTYWSDHCRHSTFHTELDSVDIEDDRIRSAWERYLALRRELGRTDRPVTLMDLATIGARALKKRGLLTHWVESEC